MQCWEWGELKSRTGWEMLPVAVERSGQIVAGAMVLARKMPLGGKCLLYAPRGPIVDFTDREAWEALVRELRVVARAHGGMALKVDPAVVAAETKKILEAMRGRPGHIFNLGHGLTPAAKLENITALVETVKNDR